MEAEKDKDMGECQQEGESRYRGEGNIGGN